MPSTVEFVCFDRRIGVKWLSIIRTKLITNINPYLKTNDVVLLNPKHSLGESCFSNVFSFGTLPNQRLIYPLMNLLYVNNLLSIVYNKDDE